MKKFLSIAVLGLLLVSAQARAEDEKKLPPQKSAQQDKMKRCNAEAKGMKGEERKSKMSACLKG